MSARTKTQRDVCTLGIFKNFARVTRERFIFYAETIMLMQMLVAHKRITITVPYQVSCFIYFKRMRISAMNMLYVRSYGGTYSYTISRNITRL